MVSGVPEASEVLKKRENTQAHTDTDADIDTDTDTDTHRRARTQTQTQTHKHTWKQQKGEFPGDGQSVARAAGHNSKQQAKP